MQIHFLHRSRLTGLRSPTPHTSVCRFELRPQLACTVLDLLHARKVSLLNLRFNSAQFPRCPDYRPLSQNNSPDCFVRQSANPPLASLAINGSPLSNATHFSVSFRAAPSARLHCLGFAPRSESFAFEPAVQLRSISSLSGLSSFRPSANPLKRDFVLSD